jgi:thiol-disulfide isomerase/thioredoxin
MLTPTFFREKLNEGLAYDTYVTSGREDQRANFARVHDRIRLTADQSALLGSFTRKMHVLVLSGLWCGDCAAQVPMLDHIALASRGTINLRILDRDENLDLAEAVKICGGLRVPTAIWLNEDFDFVSILGDRTLARYRAMAKKSLGAACPLPGAGVPDDELAATVADWVNEFERVHLVLRLSPKLRERYND